MVSHNNTDHFLSLLSLIRCVCSFVHIGAQNHTKIIECLLSTTNGLCTVLKKISYSTGFIIAHPYNTGILFHWHDLQKLFYGCMHVCPSKKSIKKRHAKTFLSVIKNRFTFRFRVICKGTVITRLYIFYGFSLYILDSLIND